METNPNEAHSIIKIKLDNQITYVKHRCSGNGAIWMQRPSYVRAPGLGLLRGGVLSEVEQLHEILPITLIVHHEEAKFHSMVLIMRSGVSFTRENKSKTTDRCHRCAGQNRDMRRMKYLEARVPIHHKGLPLHCATIHPAIHK